MIYNCDNCSKEIEIENYTIGSEYWCKECWEKGFVFNYMTGETKVMDENAIYVLSEVKDKPLKIVFEELPCPMNCDIRCEHSKMESEGTTIELICRNKHKEDCYLK